MNFTLSVPHQKEGDNDVVPYTYWMPRTSLMRMTYL